MVRLWLLSAFTAHAQTEGESLLQQEQKQKTGWFERFTRAGNPVEFFNNDDLNKVLPMAPDSYPEQLQGIIWMDQAGYYAHSDVPAAVRAPDGCFSFGDTEFSELEEVGDTGSINVDTHGPAWQWFNNAKGYVFYNMLSRNGFTYKFQFTKNYTHAQILPSATLMVGGLTLAPELVDFDMQYQSLYKDEKACPRHNTPEMEACLGTAETVGPACVEVKKQISKCAKWKRSSTLLQRDQTAEYFAFEIVDNKGQKREPYYSMYLEWINSQAAPSVGSAKSTLTGIDQFNFKDEPATSFRGIRPTPLGGAGDYCDGNWECQTKCCKRQFWSSDVGFKSKCEHDC